MTFTPPRKSRNGCLNCRAKRQKCDEQKPACGRCIRLRVECAGYNTPALVWSTKHEVFQPSRTSPQDTCSDIITSRPLPLSFIESDLTSQMEAQSTSGEPDARSATSSFAVADIPLDGGPYFATPLDELPAFGSLGLPPTPGNNAGVEDFFDVLNNLDSVYSHPPPIRLSSAPHRSVEDDIDYENTLVEFGLEKSYSSPPRGTMVSRMPGHVSKEISNRRTMLRFPLMRTLNDISSGLVEYYFRDVASLFSCYDGAKNPFRTQVAQSWQSSPVICRTLQSMAATCLVDAFPHLGIIATQFRQEAIALLDNDTKFDDTTLLALLMLGQTSSWHEPADLGISFFNKLRQYFQQFPSKTHSGAGNHNIRFFQESLIYWEMLLSYVTDTHLHPSRPLTSANDYLVLQQLPHPWTGIASNIQSTVYQVGRLVRSERQRIRSQRCVSYCVIKWSQQAIEHAKELEEMLLSFKHPTEMNVLDPGDSRTPVWHLSTIAEIYRSAGLIQLYRTFPDLLSQRMASEGSFKDLDQYTLESTLMGGGVTETFLDTSTSAMNEWLTQFALTTLKLLKVLPEESHTSCVQPFLLVAISGELRLPIHEVSPLSATTCSPNNFVHGEPSDSSSFCEVVNMRKFVIARLTSYLHIMPPRPMHVCLDIIRRTWRLMDESRADVYWMDVMIDNGLETTMG